MTTLSRRHALALTAGALSLSALPAATARAAAPAIRVGEIGLSFHQVAAAVVLEVLERLGHDTAVSAAAHDEMFRRLAAGEVDMLAVAWLPGAHGHLFKANTESVERLGTLYSDAKLYWAVPDYVPAAAVASIADLTKPDVAAKMDRLIRSIGPSAGLSVRSGRAMELYGLPAAGYRLETGDAAGWIANYRAAAAEKRWMVMPLWRPQFLNATERFRVLDDPKEAFPPADEAVLVVSKTALAALPPRTVAALRRLDVGLDGISAMDKAVNVDKRTPREAARAWMAENAAKVDGWLAV